MGFVIHNIFDREEIVYLVTDPEQLRRVVVAFYVDSSNAVRYELKCGTEFSMHFDYEISRERQEIEE